MEFYATCPKGFEQLLADELRTIGCKQVRPLKGQVSFGEGLREAYRACLWSRLASRIVAVIARVDAANADTLYEGVRSLPWADHLASGTSFAVEAHGTNAELRNTRFVSLRVKDAIVDEMLARTGTRPMVNVDRPGLRVSARVSRNRATIGIDLSGAPLFKRGYEPSDQHRLPTPMLRPDYAAALLAFGGWESTCANARERGGVPTLLSVFPGAGTMLVEAAGMALGQAPGITRYRWGFEGWAAHEADTWDRELENARQRTSQSSDVLLLWRETRQKTMASAQQMLHACALSPEIRAAQGHERADLMVCDLSWASPDELPQLAAALSEVSLAARASDCSRATALSFDGLVDAALGCSPRLTMDVLVGRDDASMRSYDDLVGATAHPQVSVAGAEVPVYVAASDQFAARLSKMAKQRAKWARREDISCYRVYDADLPDYAVTIDLFEESPEVAKGDPRRWLQLYEYAPPKGVDQELARKRLFDVLAIAPSVLDVPPRNVIVRTRTHGRGGSQYADEASAARKGKAPIVAGAELPRGAHLIDEGGLLLEVNFTSRLDCGIFLDHRDTRSMLREMAKQATGSKRFLNLFAYTGTATCYAADGGMRYTTTVDLSRPSLDWARRNMARNGFNGPEHEFVQADVLAWVSEQRHSANRWDLVFCDVPTFSNSQRMRKSSFDVQRDHVELLISVSRLLTRGSGEGGVCVFSCNLRTFKPDVAALAKAGVSIEDITGKTIPEDFKRNQRVHHCYLVRRT